VNCGSPNLRRLRFQVCAQSLHAHHILSLATGHVIPVLSFHRDSDSHLGKAVEGLGEGAVAKGLHAGEAADIINTRTLHNMHLGEAVEGLGEGAVAKGLDASERLPQRQQRDRSHAHQPVGLQVAHVDVEVRAACNDNTHPPETLHTRPALSSFRSPLLQAQAACGNVSYAAL